MSTSSTALKLESLWSRPSLIKAPHLHPSDLHSYQHEAIEHGLQCPQSMLWLDLGLGKTVTTLSIIAARMDYAQVFGTLVIGPLRVIQTVWKQEAKAWSHTSHLTFSMIHGNVATRERALCRHADVYLINYENVRWLVDAIKERYLSKGLYPPFNMLVADEVSKLKDPSTHRHHALQQILPYIPYRMGLTGTPASNGYIDLFGQYLAIDSGVRLGHQITKYRKAFFDNKGYGFNKFVMKAGAEDDIQSRISDITLQMSSKDKLNLPQSIVNDIMIDLTPKTRKAYEQLEKEMFLRMDDGESVEVFNAAALSTKCHQAANGAMYIEPKSPKWSLLHDQKLDALEDIVEESGGQPILCLTAFKHDRERIMKKFPGAEFIGGTMTQATIEDMVDRWTRGEIPLLVGHPASIGHGLNLQYGGHIMVWFGLNWSLELYEQAVARLDRQGQTQPVMIHRLIVRSTVDEVIRAAIETKAYTQNGLRQALESYRKTKKALKSP